jgi:asparagine synthase (glutamine-hydrolysing)
MPVDLPLLERMAHAAQYRGADGIRYWTQGNVGLAHLALNTTKESLRERQPSSDEKGELFLSADARIDNREELIHIFLQKGILRQPRPTDADLIIAAYLLWGEASPNYLIGDFAFALWDAPNQRLFCARDSLGVKSLHYSLYENCFYLATESQQILSIGKIPVNLNDQAVAAFIQDVVYDESVTMFSHVLRLPAGHCLSVSVNGLRLQRYWDLNPSSNIRYKQDTEYVEHFFSLLKQAVAVRLRSTNNTVAILMSGGLDSTAVAATARHYSLSQKDAPQLKTYSFIFDQLDSCDEKTYIESTIARLEIEGNYIGAEQFPLLPSIEDLFVTPETPFVAWMPLLGRIFANLQETNNNVLLTGQGGDTLLMGSSLVFLERLLKSEFGVIGELSSLASELNIPLRHALYATLIAPLIPQPILTTWRRLKHRHTEIPDWLTDNFVDQTAWRHLQERKLARKRAGRFSRQVLYEAIMGCDQVRANVYFHDCLGALFGVESRHPLLDRTLAEFIFAIPTTFLYRGGLRKYILREAMSDKLPDNLRTRRIKTSLQPWLIQSLREKQTDYIEEILGSSFAAERGYVNSERLLAAFEKLRIAPTEKIEPQLWRCINLEIWLRRLHEIEFL